MEVLDQWLRNFPGRPTWRDVANALRRTGFQQLANEIEMVYETGIESYKFVSSLEHSDISARIILDQVYIIRTNHSE